MSRYGLFLCPKFYRNEHGFEGEARGLLLLDQKGIIQPNAAKENNFTRLFTSSTAVLYAVNPNPSGGYITASQLLQALNLGRIAKHISITLPELMLGFKNECLNVDIDLNLLDEKIFIGHNVHGEEVYEMLSGRYLVDRNGLKKRDVNPSDLLYGVDDNNHINETWMISCLQALLYPVRGNHGIIDGSELSAIAKKILRLPPAQFASPHNFIPISFIERQDYPQHLQEQMLRIIDEQDANLVDNYLFAEELSIVEFINSVYQRDIAQNRTYQASLSAPAITMLGRVLFFDDKQNVYCPEVGNLALLAVFISAYKRKKVNLEIYEPYQDVKMGLVEYLEKIEDVEDILIHETINSQSGEQHDLSLTFAPNDDTHVGVKIPLSTQNTHNKAHQLILDVLSKRKHEGRSIFITHVDNPNNIGLVDNSSFHLISYLLQQYENVYVLDASSELLAPSIYKYPVRIYFIGNKSDIHQNYEYNRFQGEKKLNTIANIEGLFNFCADYIDLLKSEQVSNTEIMDMFEIGIQNLIQQEALLDDLPEDSSSANAINLTKSNSNDDAQQPDAGEDGSLDEWFEEDFNSSTAKESKQDETVEATGDNKDQKNDDAIDSSNKDGVESDVKSDNDSNSDIADHEKSSDDSSDEESYNDDDLPSDDDLPELDLEAIGKQVKSLLDHSLEYDGEEPDFDHGLPDE